MKSIIFYESLIFALFITAKPHFMYPLIKSIFSGVTNIIAEIGCAQHPNFNHLNSRIIHEILIQPLFQWFHEKFHKMC